MTSISRLLGCFVGFCLSAVAAEPVGGLRVLVWNIHHGQGIDGRLDLERIAKVISRERPDVVMLQEVDQNCTRSGKVDQTVELARLTGLKGIFGKAMDLQGGAYGQALLCRWDLTDLKIHRLPGTGEPRIAMSARVAAPTGPLTVASVHLDFNPQQNAQATACAAALSRIDGPLVLAGDFNAVPGTPVIANFTKEPWTTMAKEAPVATDPADKPEKEIDHVVLRGLRAVGPATVLAEAVASDHRPVLAIVAPSGP